MVKASEYFGRIPIWDAEKSQDVEKIEENFTFCKDISPLPVTRLEHWQDFQQFVGNFYNNKVDEGLIFRGQRRYDWKLISSLGRTKIYNFGYNVEEKHFKRFHQSIRGRIQDQSLLKEELDPDEENELWSIGQHQGLMTPLLDWTYSAYVALFFAFIEEDTIEESLMPNYYRSVYLLDSSYFKGLIKDSKVRIFEPTKDEYGRLVNQNGLFTISHLDIDIETEIFNSLHHFFKGRLIPSSAFLMAKFSCKIYIKNKDREECLQYLEHMNINHKSLFPDLHGSAYFCNNRIENFGYDLQKSITDGGSLTFVSREKHQAYKKGKLYYGIEKVLNKILNDSLSDGEKAERGIKDRHIEEMFKEDPPEEDLILVPQIEILTIEITRQIEKLQELPITERSYESLMRAKIDLILTGFDLKGLEHIQAKKLHIINKIMVIIKKQNDKG